MSTKDEYIAKLKAQLDAWSADIDTLEAKTNLAKAEFSNQYAEQLLELKAKRDEATAKMLEVQNAAEDAWDELVKGGEEAWGSIVKAVAEARKKFTDQA